MLTRHSLYQIISVSSFIFVVGQTSSWRLVNKNRLAQGEKVGSGVGGGGRYVGGGGAGVRGLT